MKETAAYLGKKETYALVTVPATHPQRSTPSYQGLPYHRRSWHPPHRHELTAVATIAYGLEHKEAGGNKRQPRYRPRSWGRTFDISLLSVDDDVRDCSSLIVLSFTLQLSSQFFKVLVTAADS